MAGTSRAGCSLIVASALVLLWPAFAIAQTGTRPPRVTIAAGGGVSRSLHADSEGTAGAWELLVSGPLGSRVGLEIGLATTQHTETSERRDVNLQGPGGIIGRAGRILTETTRTGRDLQVSVIRHVRVGRAVLSAGGGVGILALRREHAVMVSDCVSSVAAVCQGSTTRNSTSSATVQAVTGVDVAVVSRVSTYGRFTFVVPTRDAGSSNWRITAGARIAVVR